MIVEYLIKRIKEAIGFELIFRQDTESEFYIAMLETPILNNRFAFFHNENKNEIHCICLDCNDSLEDFSALMNQCGIDDMVNMLSLNLRN